MIIINNKLKGKAEDQRLGRSALEIEEKADLTGIKTLKKQETPAITLNSVMAGVVHAQIIKFKL